MDDDDTQPTPTPTEEELRHALDELMRRIPDQDREQRAAVMAAAVRSALYARMAQTIDPVAHIQNPEPPISDEAELTLAAFRQDPPFSLPRIQTRTAQKRLDQELDQWPAERRAELIHEMRERLERRRMAVGEHHHAADAAQSQEQGQQWLNDAIDEALRGGDEARPIDDILQQAEKRLAFQGLVREILAQPEGDQIGAMRSAAGQMRRDRLIGVAMDAIVGDRSIPEPVPSAESDRPRWGQITQVYEAMSAEGAGEMDVWDGHTAWPVDTRNSVIRPSLGSVVRLRPHGEWAVIERIGQPDDFEG